MGPGGHAERGDTRSEGTHGARGHTGRGDTRSEGVRLRRGDTGASVWVPSCAGLSLHAGAVLFSLVAHAAVVHEDVDDEGQTADRREQKEGDRQPWIAEEGEARSDIHQ